MVTAFPKTALACALAWFAALVSPHVSAQTGSGGSTGFSPLLSSDFTFKLETYDPGQKFWVLLDDTQAQYFFNRARCECIGDSTDHSGEVVIAIQPASTT